MGIVAEAVDNIGKTANNVADFFNGDSDEQKAVQAWRSQYGQPGMWTAEEQHAAEQAILNGQDPWSVLPESYEARVARRSGEGTVSPQTTPPATFYEDRTVAGNTAAADAGSPNGGILPAPTVGGLPAVIAGEQAAAAAAGAGAPAARKQMGPENEYVDPLLEAQLRQKSLFGLKGTFRAPRPRKSTSPDPMDVYLPAGNSLLGGG